MSCAIARVNGTAGLPQQGCGQCWRSFSSLAVRVMALGQAQNTGTVSGNVKDGQAKVVVGAEIVLFNLATNAKRVEKSNAEGEYLFSDISIGEYILTVTAPGFGTTEIDGVNVDADANVRSDVQLRPATVNQEVNVVSQGSTLDTRSATLGTLIDRNEVENLPVDGNNVVSLTALLPGVSNVNAPTTFTSDTGGPTFNISGSRNNQNLFLLDGQLWNNLFYNTGLNFPPGQTLQEISILLNNYKAQYGRNVGSIMNVLTRQGTNTIHGSFGSTRRIRRSTRPTTSPRQTRTWFRINLARPLAARSSGTRSSTSLAYRTCELRRLFSRRPNC